MEHREEYRMVTLRWTLEVDGNGSEPFSKVDFDTSSFEISSSEL
jgi:hypothetical protein